MVIILLIYGYYMVNIWLLYGYYQWLMILNHKYVTFVNNYWWLTYPHLSMDDDWMVESGGKYHENMDDDWEILVGG
jgi:hypothetical protein